MSENGSFVTLESGSTIGSSVVCRETIAKTLWNGSRDGVRSALVRG